jgi:hypothetical protein
MLWSSCQRHFFELAVGGLNKNVVFWGGGGGGGGGEEENNRETILIRVSPLKNNKKKNGVDFVSIENAPKCTVSKNCPTNI